MCDAFCFDAIVFAWCAIFLSNENTVASLAVEEVEVIYESVVSGYGGVRVPYVCSGCGSVCYDEWAAFAFACVSWQHLVMWLFGNSDEHFQRFFFVFDLRPIGDLACCSCFVS